MSSANPPASPPDPNAQLATVHEVHHYRPKRDPGLAVVLELLPGILIHTFGIGNIYAGNVVGGVLMMIGYWVLQVVNLLLCLVLIGFVTLPLTWVAFMIFCPIAANSASQRSRPVCVGTDQYRRLPMAQ